MCKINLFDKFSFVLVIISAINWGTIGLLNVNFISLLVGGSVLFQRIIYILVFLSALDIIYLLFKCNLIKMNTN